jgi:MscS family membrane protein
MRKMAFFFLFIQFLFMPAILNGAEEPTLKDVLDSEKQAKETAENAKKTATLSGVSVPNDDYNRGVPRSSVQGFLETARRGDFERAAHYLDMRYLPYDMDAGQGTDYARKLLIALDRALWVDISMINDHPEGHSDDGLMRHQERVSRVDLDGKNVDILMQRIPREDGVLIWKFSGSTVEMIPELYAKYGYGPIGEKLAEMLPSQKFLDLELWQWVMLFALVVAAFIVVYIPTKIISFFLKCTKLRYRDQLASLCVGPIRFYVILLVLSCWEELIHPTAAFRVLMQAQTILMVSLIWLSFSVIGLFRDVLINRFEKEGRKGVVVLLRPMASVLRIMVFVVMLMIWFENVGLKATTVLTGLGVGGLAVALATQKSIENLIGAITLYTTTPVKVGDFCRFGDSIGTVEDIGLRYTRIRTLGRTVIHVPNASFVEMHLESYSYREKILFHPVIKIRRDASPDQMRYILIEIRKMLYSHPRVDAEPARVRFKEFGGSSLDIHVFAYVKTTVYSEYLEVGEDLNLRIMDIIKEAGSKLAVPIQNVWFEKSSPPEKELADSAEKQTRQWREKNELCLPKFPDEDIDQLCNTLDYPPEGSAVKENK